MSTSTHAAAEMPKVEISDLHKLFGELHVLRGIDLIVPPGSVTVLIGPSGSGKSTLLRCINELESIDAGRVKVDGELIGMREVERGGRTELHALSDKARAAQRAKIGMVFQRFQPLPPHDGSGERHGGSGSGEEDPQDQGTKARYRAAGAGGAG